MNHLKFLVTGTGRCGTVFMAKLLTSLGINCGHESVFTYENEKAIIEKLVTPKLRTISNCSTINLLEDESLRTPKNWIDPQKTIAESSYLAVPHLFHPHVANIPIIHVVRNPLDVISSYTMDFQYFNDKVPNKENPYNELGWENKIYDFCPELSHINNVFERACWFYVKWTDEIEKACLTRSHLFLNLERLDYEKLFTFLDIKNKPKEIFSDKTANSNKKRQTNIELTTIPNGLIKKLFSNKMIKYGYLPPSVKIL
jgi:hypothetical protein